MLWTTVDVCTFVCSHMASIFRKPGSPFFFAAFRDARGQRCQHTTKTNERSKALAMALAWERAGQDGKKGVLTEAASRKVLSQLFEQTSGTPLAFFTVEGWINEWLANRAGTASKGTLIRYAGTCRDFLAGIGDRANSVLVRLQPPICGNIVTVYGKPDTAPQLVTSRLKFSRRLWSKLAGLALSR